MSIDAFRAKLKGGTRPNLFKAVINFPSGVGGDIEKTSFLCKAAQLPGNTLGQIVVPYKGRQVKLPGDRTFEPWTITVINDKEFKIRDSFERWMDIINSNESNISNHDPVKFEADMAVQQLGEKDQVLKTYDFVGCFPTNVAPVELSYETNDAIAEFTVEIQYQYWKSNTTT